MIDFITLLSSIQVVINNLINVLINVFLNKIFYKCKILKIMNLLNNDIVKTKVKDDIPRMLRF